MDSPSPVNPFVPGRGQLPPYLAGRDVEQGELKDLLAYVYARRGTPRDAVLSGPRGNGKTSLLRWFQQEIEAGKPDVDVVWMTPDEVSSLDRLATALVPPRRFASLRPRALSLSIGVGKLGWKLGAAPGSLTTLLTARCRERRLVLLLDEAHTLQEDVGRALLNASQRVAAEAPFLLVMAGTPGLQARLNTMSATFWSRATKLGIGRLGEAAAAAALTRPLAALTPAIAFAETALRQVTEESQGYPYFLQLWGAALWKAATSSGAVRIDEALVADAKREFGRQRMAYYEDRREELERQNLLDPATRVAVAFDDQRTLRGRELNAAIAPATGGVSAEQALQYRDRLAGVGYVWKPPDAPDVWQPGIPSLMDYIKTHAA